MDAEGKGFTVMVTKLEVSLPQALLCTQTQVPPVEVKYVEAFAPLTTLPFRSHLQVLPGVALVRSEILSPEQIKSEEDVMTDTGAVQLQMVFMTPPEETAAGPLTNVKFNGKVL